MPDEELMLASHPIIGFVPTSDLAVAEAFYHRTLGLPIAERNPFALVLSAPGGSSIRCIQAPPFKPQPFTVLGWEVPDLPAAAAALLQAGIEPILYPHFEQDEQGIWTAPGGDQVLWFHDPEGNVLSLSQHVRKASA